MDRRQFLGRSILALTGFALMGNSTCLIYPASVLDLTKLRLGTDSVTTKATSFGTLIDRLTTNDGSWNQLNVTVSSGTSTVLICLGAPGSGDVTTFMVEEGALITWGTGWNNKVLTTVYAQFTA